MKTKVISYSFTGNNEAFAADFAREVGAEHIRITEPKKRTAGKILKENLFKKDPKINLSGDEITDEDFVVFFSPFWFGKMASPLRTYLKQLKNKPTQYGFISLCVGFENPEDAEKLKAELASYCGSEPEFVIINKIADLLPSDPPPTQNMLNDYRVSEEDLERIIPALIESVGSKLPD